jgi:hypothetical protein
MGRNLKSIGARAPHTAKEEKPLTSAYIARARLSYAFGNSDLEIDLDPKVSVAEDGAWVAAWVWVPRED